MTVTRSDHLILVWQIFFFLGEQIFAKEAGFVAQRELLREVVEEAELKIIYYPKYHCELNYIELIWSYMKAKLRRDCTSTFSDLKQKLDLLLQNISLNIFQSSARFCYRFMAGYCLNLSGSLLDYTVKKYKGHRQIPNNVI